MKTLQLILISLLLFLLIACKPDKKKEIAELVQEWQGKEIIFPERPVFTLYAKDTIDYTIPKSDYKVLVYVDSTCCVGCKLQLSKWKELIQQVNSMTQEKIPFIFFFQTKNIAGLQFLLKENKFNLPVSVDSKGLFYNQNKFPSDPIFQTFLLDKNNRVVVIGNPVHNTAVKTLYLNQITGNADKLKIRETTALIENTKVHLGDFKLNEKRKAEFFIRNTGSAPLIITDTHTICGCTVVSYDKKPAAPGESLCLVVEKTGQSTGKIYETITVEANTIEKLKLIITGNIR